MSSIQVLIVEGDLAEARFLEEAILEIAEETASASGVWRVARVLLAFDMEDATILVRKEAPDIVLLNPNQPGMTGLAAFRHLRACAPDVPVILILDDIEDSDLGRRALREGAQDFLIRTDLDCRPLAHAIEAAIERARLTRALWSTFQFDELTGLCNRSGLVYQGELARTLLARWQEPMRLIVAELPPETASRRNGRRVFEPVSADRDLEILETAGALRGCLEPGDLLGRVAEGQFCILSSKLTMSAMQSRMQANQPKGEFVFALRWSELETAASTGESLDQLISTLLESLPESRLALRAVH